MSHAEFTPGPWEVVENDGAYMNHPEMGAIRIEERDTVHEMVLAVVITDCPLLVEAGAANARLIAAAPDGYNLAVEILRALDARTGYQCSDVTRREMEPLRRHAAEFLAKVYGKELTEPPWFLSVNKGQPTPLS